MSDKKKMCVWIWNSNKLCWDTECKYEAEWPDRHDYCFCPYCGGCIKVEEEK